MTTAASVAILIAQLCLVLLWAIIVKIEISILKRTKKEADKSADWFRCEKERAIRCRTERGKTEEEESA